MPLRGDFIKDGEKIVYQGMIQQLPLEQLPNPLLAQITLTPDGIVLFEDMILNGSIEASVAFEEFNQGDWAQIVFNYQNDNCFMCAGIMNSSPMYGFYYINGQLNPVYVTGFIDELHVTEFKIKVQLIGSLLELFINGIKVLVSAIPFGVNYTQVGIWVKSKKQVTISNFKTNYKRPEVFIVSQFGGYYDILYDEVIKPVCEKLNYAPVRGDEVASCTLILNDIIASIRNAAVIIADITPDNPNVFYEVGYAHALVKPTILLCEKTIRDRLPFDVSGFRTIFYDDSIGGKRQVEEKLEAHLQNINYSTIM